MFKNLHKLTPPPFSSYSASLSTADSTRPLAAPPRHPFHSLLKTSIANHAKCLGFDLVGFCKPKIEQKYLDALDSWVKKGAAADMQYMKDSEKLAARSDLSKILPGVKSVITLGVNYYYDQPPLKRGYGRVARYAAFRDYHKVIGKMLKKLVAFLEQIEPDKNHKHKGYVDTGPVLERALAEQSGIGQIGKNGLVITREFGSWIFLAEVLTTIDLAMETSESRRQADLSSVDSSATAATTPKSTVPTDEHAVPGRRLAATTTSVTSSHTPSIATPTSPEHLSKFTTSAVPGGAFPARALTATPSTPSLSPIPPLRQKPFGLCGQCTKCIKACPTGAIIAPGVVDSRLCISYLTIENRKKIPTHLAKKIKKTRRLFGCDICQEVCPHNEAKQKPVRGDVFATLPATTTPTQNPSRPIPQKFAKQISLPPAPRASNFPHPIPQPSITAPDIKIAESQIPQPLSQLSLKKIRAIKREQKFRINFSGTALMRTKLKGLKRNARAITPGTQKHPRPQAAPAIKR